MLLDIRTTLMKLKKLPKKTVLRWKMLDQVIMNTGTCHIVKKIAIVIEIL